MVQEDYHSQNPYHNAVHAADVTQAMYCYLKEPKVGVLFLILPSFFFSSFLSSTRSDMCFTISVKCGVLAGPRGIWQRGVRTAVLIFVLRLCVRFPCAARQVADIL